MSINREYTEVKEITDDFRETNDLLGGGGWDLLEIGKRKQWIAEDVYTEEIIYVIGHRADAQ